MEISVPTYADPIQFETLDCKLACNILQVERGSYVCVVIQKPVRWLNLRLDVNPLWPEPLGT